LDITPFKALPNRDRAMNGRGRNEMSPKRRKDRIGERRQVAVDHASDDSVKKRNPPAANDDNIA
jgi:hypothetical protein